MKALLAGISMAVLLAAPVVEARGHGGGHHGGGRSHASRSYHSHSHRAIHVHVPKARVSRAPVYRSSGSGAVGSSAGRAGAPVVEDVNKPIGARAKCGDGTYSFSATRSGACAGHGGVVGWLR